MPYRVKTGQEVLVVTGLHLDTQTLTRDIEFEKKDLIASPLPEHNKEGIRSSIHGGFPWGFNVKGRWTNGTRLTAIYATEVHMVDRATPKTANTRVVYGSKGTPYTITLTDDGKKAAECTCPAFRFHRDTCKHLKEWNSR